MVSLLLQQHRPRGPGEHTRRGQGLLEGVAVRAHLHQQGAGGELLIVAVFPQADGANLFSGGA